METGLTRNQIITQLARSPHGDLKSYIGVAQPAAQQDPEFVQHLIAWNAQHGQIRDSKVALPVLSLVPKLDPELSENALAHLALLDPRNLVRAVRFAREVKTPDYGRRIRHVVRRYLHSREKSPHWFERSALQHRKAMKELYALCRIHPSDHARAILFERQKLGVFKEVAALPSMSAAEAAGTILKQRIPFLVALGALGAKARDPALVLALIEQMSPSELVTNTQMLERLGVKAVPELRAAYEQALLKAADSKKVTLKTTRAAEAVQDASLKNKLRGLQEKQIDRLAVDGNWLVICDKSGSMSAAIEMARHIASTLARFVSGNVHLVFVDTAPRYINATAKTYDDLLQQTRSVIANGGTSLGCGMQYAREAHLQVDGVVVVSDGAENTPPMFVSAYESYLLGAGKDNVPVYLYWTSGENSQALQTNMARAGHDLQVFDLRASKIDYYALPNLVQTMRTNRYSLADEIMQTKLLTLEQVFKDARAA